MTAVRENPHLGRTLSDASGHICRIKEYMDLRPVRRMDGRRPKDMGWKHMDGYIQIGAKVKDLHITY